MWVFTKYGFFSAVCARQGDGQPGQSLDRHRIMVRARVREHLEALRQRFPADLGACEILEHAGTDYRFRLLLPKTTWAQIMMHLAAEVDYGNFKSTVARVQTSDAGRYEESLHRVWSVMHKLQES
jgi:hypothetical protein